MALFNKIRGVLGGFNNLLIMADFEKAIAKVLSHEGGYVWAEHDSGGETNFGITDKLDGLIDRMSDVDGDGDGDVLIFNLSKEQAKQIYKREFWNKMQGDLINDQQVANIVFDAFVNSGKVALKQLQQVIGVDADGSIGPKTLNTLNYASPMLVFNSFKDARIRFYKALVDRKPTQNKFLKGWLNRINSFKYELT
jgi:lysozyme family protein